MEMLREGAIIPKEERGAYSPKELVERYTDPLSELTPELVLDNLRNMLVAEGNKVTDEHYAYLQEKMNTEIQNVLANASTAEELEQQFQTLELKAKDMLALAEVENSPFEKARREAESINPPDADQTDVDFDLDTALDSIDSWGEDDTQNPEQKAA